MYEGGFSKAYKSKMKFVIAKKVLKEKNLYLKEKYYL